MSTRFLRKKAVSERYDVTIRSVERMVEDGRLPEPVYRGRMPLWKEADLDESDRAAALAPRPPKRHALSGKQSKAATDVQAQVKTPGQQAAVGERRAGKFGENK
jgi:predicted DNA-binding transcriptional regulator AlpA